MSLRKKLKLVFEQSGYLKAAVPELKSMIWRVVMWLTICEVVILLQSYPAMFLIDAVASQSVPKRVVSVLCHLNRASGACNLPRLGLFSKTSEHCPS